MLVAEDTLEAMTQAIVDEVHPELVLLFGSQARGEASEDSDVDFIVVLPDHIEDFEGKVRTSGKLYRLLAQFETPVDVLLYRRAEFDRWKGARNHCIGRALREGRVLYER